MISEENNRRNLATAANLARSELGLGEVSSDWTFDDRVSYLNRFRSKVLAFPQSFTPETVAIATGIRTQDYQLTPGFAEGETDPVFWQTVVSRAADVVQIPVDFGNASIEAANAITVALSGTASALSTTGKIAPFVLPVAAVLLLYLVTEKASTRVRRAIT